MVLNLSVNNLFYLGVEVGKKKLEHFYVKSFMN